MARQDQKGSRIRGQVVTLDKAIRDYFIAEWEERASYPRHEIGRATIQQLRWIAEAKRHTANALDVLISFQLDGVK